MAEIMEKKKLSGDIYMMKVHAPIIAEKRKAGQFIILRASEKGERIPLTIVDSDPVKGSVTIVFQVVGLTTSLLSQLKKGDSILDVAGPLGKPTHIERFGHVAVVGGGIGIAVAYPIAKAMKEAGNFVTSVIGARTRDLLTLEKELTAISDKIIVMTDDGSYQRPGLVTEGLKETLDNEKVDLVVAIGPVPMMRAVSELTRPYQVKTVVSLNPIMVDGTGMCGACRVTIGGQTRFACVDGPEFDGHEVDFDDLTMRLRSYKAQELQAFKRIQENVSHPPEELTHV